LAFPSVTLRMMGAASGVAILRLCC
jgi:hypothetical protein